jgi:hypothetical protein
MDTKEYPSIKDERFQHHQQAPLEDPRALQAKVDDILRHAGEVVRELTVQYHALTSPQDDPAKAVEALIPHLTPAQHRKLIFKLDCTVLPICWLLYFVRLPPSCCSRLDEENRSTAWTELRSVRAPLSLLGQSQSGEGNAGACTFDRKAGHRD